MASKQSQHVSLFVFSSTLNTFVFRYIVSSYATRASPSCVSLLFRNRSPRIEFGYAVSAYSAHTTGRDVTRSTWSVDCRCQMRSDTRRVLPPSRDSLALPRQRYLVFAQQIFGSDASPDRCLRTERTRSLLRGVLCAWTQFCTT